MSQHDAPCDNCGTWFQCSGELLCPACQDWFDWKQDMRDEEELDAVRREGGREG